MSVNKEQMRNLDFWRTDLKSLHTSALSQSNDIRPCLHVFPTQPIILNIWWVIKALLVLQTLKHTARHTGSLLLLVLPAVLPCSVFKGCDHSGMIYTVQTDVLQYSREEEYVCILKRHCGGVCQLSMKSGGGGKRLIYFRSKIIRTFSGTSGLQWSDANMQQDD